MKAVCVALVAAAAALAYANPTVIYSEVPTSPTSDVPGLGGAKFDSFDRPFVSQDGSWWIISASSDLATSMDEVVIVGQGSTGATVVQEGVTEISTGEFAGFIDQTLGINNSGNYVYATNTDAAAQDEVIVRVIGGAQSVAAREGEATPIAGEVYGSSLHSPQIANDNSVGFVAPSTVGGLPSVDDNLVILKNNVLAQSNVTVPGGQAGGAVDTWQNFDFGDLHVAADGSYLLQGDTNNSDFNADDVVVVNGMVMIQEGSTLNGSASPVDIVSESTMEANGNWYARGDYENNVDFLVHNGATVAETGDAVPGGVAGETFSDAIFSSTFFTWAANGDGDYVYGATTSNPDVNADAVIVLNNASVLLRQGDQVDLDGDGVLDPFFIDIFNNDDMFLAGQVLYFTANLVDASGNAAGQAFMRFVIPEPAGAFALLSLAVVALRRR